MFDDCEVAVRAVVLRALVHHVYSNGVFLPLSNQSDEDDLIEMRAHAFAEFTNQTADSAEVDDLGVLEANALAGMWFFKDLQLAYKRYIVDTFTWDNIIQR